MGGCVREGRRGRREDSDWGLGGALSGAAKRVVSVSSPRDSEFQGKAPAPRILTVFKLEQ